MQDDSSNERGVIRMLVGWRYLRDDLRWSILESPWEEAEAVHRER